MTKKRNEGIEYDDVLQNRFTAYLLTAVKRRKLSYAEGIVKIQRSDSLLYHINNAKAFDFETHLIESLPLDIQLKNDRIFDALLSLTDQEKFVFLQRIICETSFEKIAQELALSYKGVAGIYYRAMRKVREYMRRIENDI